MTLRHALAELAGRGLVTGRWAGRRHRGGRAQSWSRISPPWPGSPKSSRWDGTVACVLVLSARSWLRVSRRGAALRLGADGTRCTKCWRVRLVTVTHRAASAGRLRPPGSPARRTSGWTARSTSRSSSQADGVRRRLAPRQAEPGAGDRRSARGRGAGRRRGRAADAGGAGPLTPVPASRSNSPVTCSAATAPASWSGHQNCPERVRVCLMIMGRNGRIWAETVHDHESLAASGGGGAGGSVA